MPAVEPRIKRWTRQEYHRLGEEDHFQDKRVQLIAGEIIEMSPQENAHFTAIELVVEELKRAFGRDFWIRAQGPLHLGDDSEPEPDVAVVKGRPRQYKAHPFSALLVVEVSDTTLAFDRRKASLYASAGIEEYWILNLLERGLEVHRQPVRDKKQDFGWRYRDLATLKEGETVSPLALPKASIRIAELLP